MADPLYQHDMDLLKAFVSGFAESTDRIDFQAVLEASRNALASSPNVDGVTVSRALRAAGFNRDHNASGKAIIYIRAES